MTAIRLPSWGEVFAPEAPWAVLLRSGTTGVWLLRGAAAEDGVDARVVGAVACRTSAGALAEWSAALQLGETPECWDEFARAAADGGWFVADSSVVLVSEAERLLADDVTCLPTLLGSLRSAVARLEERGLTLRVLFQSRFDDAPERLAVFREFDVADVG